MAERKRVMTAREIAQDQPVLKIRRLGDFKLLRVTNDEGSARCLVHLPSVREGIVADFAALGRPPILGAKYTIHLQLKFTGDEDAVEMYCEGAGQGCKVEVETVSVADRIG